VTTSFTQSVSEPHSRADSVDESSLRYGWERPVFIASVMLNFIMMGLAISLLFHEPSWIRSSGFLHKEITLIRALAITALVGVPLLVLTRNRREASIRGNSVRLSDRQFPEVYAVLKDHCRRLGMTKLPELFLTSGSIQPYSHTFSSWRENYIVLHQIIFDINDEKTMDVISFILGHELGAIRLNQTAVWNEMLLTYISSMKWLRNPLERVRTYSRDRYGATLAPNGFRGLLINAIGRRLMDQVNIETYLADEERYGGIWPLVNVFVDPRPQVLTRIRKLHDAGYPYQAYKPEAK
jgi:hypothetical protein